MTDPKDVRELLSNASSRFDTLTAVHRSWRDREVEAARSRYGYGRPPLRPSPGFRLVHPPFRRRLLPAAGGPEPRAWERRAHLWVRNPGQYRFDYDGHVFACGGDQWWELASGKPPTTARDHVRVAGMLELLRVSLLVNHAWFATVHGLRLCGDARMAGRPAIRVHAPRPAVPHQN